MTIDQIVTNITIQMMEHTDRGIRPNEIYLGKGVYELLKTYNEPLLLGSAEIEDYETFMGMDVYVVNDPDDHIRVVYASNFVRRNT